MVNYYIFFLDEIKNQERYFKGLICNQFFKIVYNFGNNYG